MAKIVLKESDIQRIIKDAINEGVMDSFNDGVSKLGSKVKKGVKDLSPKLKKGWENYKEWCKKGLEKPNPSYLGDPKDLENLGSIEDELSESFRKSIKRMVKEAICELEDNFQPDGYKR